VRLQAGKEILRPYDVATWTLPLQMGVTVERTVMPQNTTAVTSITPETKEVIARGQKLARKPVVGIYKPWSASMDEGWTRWLLDNYAVKSKSLTPQEVQKGLAGYDALILPDIEKDVIATGKRATSRSDDDVPAEYRGGLDKTGADVLKKWVENGGTLIAFAASSDYVLEQFTLPVRNALANVKSEDFSTPGSLLRLEIRADHPVTQGMAPELAAFVDRPIAFETSQPAMQTERWVLATYPEDARDILLSGWIAGADRLTRKAAAVAVTYGKGKIVLFGFKPQNRGQTHAAFPMIFNSLWWSVAPPPAAPAAP
jgi:hypothetical protein